MAARRSQSDACYRALCERYFEQRPEPGRICFSRGHLASRVRARFHRRRLVDPFVARAGRRRDIDWARLPIKTHPSHPLVGDILATPSGYLSPAGRLQLNVPATTAAVERPIPNLGSLSPNLRLIATDQRAARSNLKSIAWVGGGSLNQASTSAIEADDNRRDNALVRAHGSDRQASPGRPTAVRARKRKGKRQRPSWRPSVAQ